MIVPNKIIRYKESIIYKMMFIVDSSDKKNIKIMDLYNSLKKNYSDIVEYIYCIDVLYVLGAIDVDFAEGEIIYVERNKK